MVSAPYGGSCVNPVLIGIIACINKYFGLQCKFGLMSWNEFLLPAKLVEATTHSSFTMDPINMENPRLNRSIEENRAPAPFQKAARMQILGC